MSSLSMQGRVIICPYCNGQTEFVDSVRVYGKSYGMIYLCSPCDAYVGVHRGTDKPLGRLANKQLREYKKAAHAAFDPLWKSGEFYRQQAYAWLSKQMGLPRYQTHIGMFDVEQCKRVIEICRGYRG
ncbi:zinc-finger-containing protein [Paenibacillus alvei]|uniref:zinc-finger-containing protein n=1 Tax=Paenibacillus alvei TaxID=44250 RepID=UPI0022812974|nr:zinc-finger-containing protein [Paenibacillus alvei]MCY7484311.1 DUF3268 family zinc-finger domain-containing protein [Paenibacillus alvei]